MYQFGGDSVQQPRDNIQLTVEQRQALQQAIGQLDRNYINRFRLVDDAFAVKCYPNRTLNDSSPILNIFFLKDRSGTHNWQRTNGILILPSKVDSITSYNQSYQPEQPDTSIEASFIEKAKQYESGTIAALRLFLTKPNPSLREIAFLFPLEPELSQDERIEWIQCALLTIEKLTQTERLSSTIAEHIRILLSELTAAQESDAGIEEDPTNVNGGIRKRL